MVEILHDSDTVQVLRSPGASAFTLVAFGLMHSRANGRNFWGEKLIARTGLDCVAVMPKGPNWYPPSQMAGAIASIRTAADRPLVAYGASMGAYGALRYGRAMGAETAIAFAPQVTIDPAIAGADDPRYRRFFRAELHQGADVRAQHLAPRSWLLYDPAMPHDRFHAGLLAASGIATVELPYTGHKTVATAAAAGVATRMLAACRAGDGRTVRRLLMARRRALPEYYVALARELRRRGRNRRLLAVTRAGVSRFPGTADLHRIRAAAFEALGARDDAIAEAERAVAALPGHPLYHLRLAELRLADGQDAEAAAGLEAALAGRSHPMLWRRLAEARTRLGDQAGALQALERALAASPGNPVLLRQRDRLAARVAADATGTDHRR